MLMRKIRKPILQGFRGKVNYFHLDIGCHNKFQKGFCHEPTH